MQELLPHCAFGNLQIFSIVAKGFGIEESVVWEGNQQTSRRNGVGICGIWNRNIGTYY